MRFTALTAAAGAALLSAAPVLAGPSADALIKGYEKFLPLGDEMWDNISNLKPTNALLLAPKMVTTLTEIGSELNKQADLVRDGAEPLSDEEQERACGAFGEVSSISGQCLAGLMEKADSLSALQGTQALAPLRPVLSRFPQPWEDIKAGFLEAAPNCAQETIDNGPDVSGLLSQAIDQLSRASQCC